MRIKKPGPTLLILLCFASSAFLRLGSGGVAVAEELATSRQEAEPAIQAVDPPVEVPDIDDLLVSIRTRQQQLLEREQQIAARQQVLDVAEDRIASQMALLEAAEAKLANTLAIADSAAENDLKRLTEVYEKMKAKNAAEVFGTMDIKFAAGFLSRMKPESAAGILSEMTPGDAYAISVVMAGRNADAPTE